MIISCLLLCQAGFARQEVSLWGDQPPPYAKPHEVEEYIAPCWGSDCAYLVTDPTLTIYPAENPVNNSLVLIIPGGGYDVVAIYHEGFEIAEALAARGVSSAVLKYRLPDMETSETPEKVPLSDVRQAMKLLRENQQEYGISADQIGMVGFSAGAHLATYAGLHRDKDPALNPDFSMLIYGVSRLDSVNYQWLEEQLYHRKMNDAEVAAETLLEHVSSKTPPAFLVHSIDDDTSKFFESTEYADALIRNGVEAELHLFPRGGHGFGVGHEDTGTGQWIDLAVDWLNRLPRKDSFGESKSRIRVVSWAGPPLNVYLTVPPGLTPDRPMVFVMHGMQRNADDYRNQWHELAIENNFLLVVPEFSASSFPRSLAYNLGNTVDEDGDPVDKSRWAFSAIEKIFDEVRKRYTLNSNEYAIYGHSAGSQFVHRFLMHVPEARVSRAVLANAGWYTLPDFELEWPYGLQHSMVSEEGLTHFLELPVTVLLGDQDNDPADDSLRRTNEAMEQGQHRLARGIYYFASAQDAAASRELPLPWRLARVPGVDHQNVRMAPSAIQFLLQD